TSQNWENNVSEAGDAVRERLIKYIAEVHKDDASAKETIKQISLGGAHRTIESLGITLNRLTIPHIAIRGDVGAIIGIPAAIKALEKLGLTTDKCMRIILAYRGGDRWNVNELNLSPETVEAVAAILSAFKS